MSGSPVVVAIIDSGFAGELSGAVAGRKTFPGEDKSEGAGTSEGGHGMAMARIILSRAPRARLLDARAFSANGASSVERVAAALGWAVEEGARILNMSFGLRADRPELQRAVAGAVAESVLVVASVPARGGPVYPAAYDGVVRVTGDARCAPGEFSLLEDEPKLFAACPRPPEEAREKAPGTPETGGASFAVPYVSGALAAYLEREPDAETGDAAGHLEDLCRFRGREKRSRP